MSFLWIYTWDWCLKHPLIFPPSFFSTPSLHLCLFLPFSLPLPPLSLFVAHRSSLYLFHSKLAGNYIDRPLAARLWWNRDSPSCSVTDGQNPNERSLSSQMLLSFSVHSFHDTTIFAAQHLRWPRYKWDGALVVRNEKITLCVFFPNDCCYCCCRWWCCCCSISFCCHVCIWMYYLYLMAQLKCTMINFCCQRCRILGLVH